MLVQKNLGRKNNLIKKVFGPQTIWSNKVFVPKNNFDQIFGPKIMLVLNNIGPNNLGKKKMGLKMLVLKELW